MATLEYDEEINNCVCFCCGNNCDDITYLLKDKQVVGIRNACRLGASKVVSHADQRLLNPMIRNEDGILEETTWDKALDKVANLLSKSIRPLLYGWSESSIESIKKGIKVSQLTGAVMDNSSTIYHGTSIQAFQNVGHPVTTFGEVKNRADVIIYVGTNPMSDHPRHLSKFTAFPKGFFRQGGRKDRQVITWDPKFTNTAKVSDDWIQFNMNEDYSFFNALRAVLKGQKIEDEVAGVPRDRIMEMVNVMKNAECGVIFFGLGVSQTLSKQRNVDILIRLVEDLNGYSKWSMLPMKGSLNVGGFNVALTSETGYPYGVDFARGYPRYMIGETTTIDLLNRREPDVFISVSDDPVIQFPGYSIKHLVNIPVVQIGTTWGPITELSDIVLPSTNLGIETAGTVYRIDSVPLYMKKVVEEPHNCHSDEWIFIELYKRIQQLKSKGDK